MLIAAIDPGIKNFAFSIENVDVDTVRGIRDLSTLVLCSETVFFANIELCDTTTRELTRVLNLYTHLWEQVDVVLVERQMQFRSIINTKALRVAHHCLSYFELSFHEMVVVDFPSSNKTRVLGAPSGMTKPQRKKWSVAYASEILEERGDCETIKMRETMGRKLDDVSDCLLMCMAYTSLKYRCKKKVTKATR